MGRQVIRIGIMVLGLLAGTGGLFLLSQHFTRPRPIELRFDSGPSAEIAVYVNGAVNRPGVVVLREGDRVGAAIDAAGGVAPDADLDRINLAKRLRDEDQVTVPRLGDTVRLAQEISQSPSPSLIDLNRATMAELDALPGIGTTYAQRILDSRQRDGPFRSADELLDRQIMPRATYDRIKDRVTARP